MVDYSLNYFIIFQLFNNKHGLLYHQNSNKYQLHVRKNMVMGSTVDPALFVISLDFSFLVYKR